MRILWANAARATLIGGMGAAFMFVGKAFITGGVLFVCYMLYTNIADYAEMSSYIWCLIIIFFIALCISVLFISVYGMCIDSIL